MARQFGAYSPKVPLGTTWEESLVLEDADGNVIDLTGYDVVAQLHTSPPSRNEETGAGSEPVLEITTAGFYDTPEDYVVEGFSVPDPDDGTILLLVAPEDFWRVSPANRRAKLVWSIMLVNDVGYTIPVVAGKVAFLPNNTVLAP
jgi:hypothetical protein